MTCEHRHVWEVLHWRPPGLGQRPLGHWYFWLENDAKAALTQKICSVLLMDSVLIWIRECRLQGGGWRPCAIPTPTPTEGSPIWIKWNALCKGPWEHMSAQIHQRPLWNKAEILKLFWHVWGGGTDANTTLETGGNIIRKVVIWEREL